MCTSHLDQKTGGGIRKGQNIYSYLWDYFGPLKSVLLLFPLFQEIFYKPKTQKAYLIFVIFFTRLKFLENKIYTEKRQFFALNL